MTEEQRQQQDQEEQMSEQELENEGAAELPDREAMSLVNLNAAVPVNAAIGLNALSDGSTATANAAQNTPITQGI
jgi:hypothetical protein